MKQPVLPVAPPPPGTGDQDLLQQESHHSIVYYEDTVLEEVGGSSDDEIRIILSKSPFDEHDDGTTVGDDYLEEEVIDDDDDDDDDANRVDLDYDVEDDASSVWIDDGRDYTKDPDSIAPRIVPHHPADSANMDGEDEVEETANDFYLELPDLDEISTLEHEDDIGGGLSEDSDIYSEDNGKVSNPTSKVTLQSKDGLLKQLKQLATLNKSTTDWDMEDTDHPERHEASTLPQSGRSEKLLNPLATTTSRPITYFQHQRRSIQQRGNKASIFCGRADELEVMRDALARRCDPGEKNAKRCLWIHGKIGIGKTALAENFIHQYLLLGNKGDSFDQKSKEISTFFVARGAFGDRALSCIPFSGLIDCLDELVLQLMQDSIGESSWADRLREGLGKDAQLLATLIPNIANLLKIERKDKYNNGSNGEHFDLMTSRLFNRMRFAIRRFFRVVCHQRKVMLFFDDLQWADEDSLSLIETILSTHALKNFFFIGCHRRVEPSHKLQRIKTRLSPLCAADITLTVLNAVESGNMMLKFLNNTFPVDEQISATEDLSAWLYDKSNGHPLHLHQLLRYLVEREKIWMDMGRWKWVLPDLKADRAARMGVEDLVSERLKHLPISLRFTLKVASFLGVKDFDLQLLRDAWQICASAERVKVIDGIDALEGAVEVLKENDLFSCSSPTKYSFAHDVIANAAFFLLPSTLPTQLALHFEFATCLDMKWIMKSHDERTHLLAMASDHFAFAVGRMTDINHKHKLARLKLNLARGAFGKAAFSAACDWLESGLVLLNSETPWKDSYTLSLKLHLEVARVKFCQGSYEASKKFASGIISNAKSPRDTIGAYEILICLAVAMNNLEEAFRLSLQALKEIFNDVPKKDVEQEVASMRELLRSKTDADLSSLPAVVHKKSATKIFFLTRLAEISWMKQDFLNQDLAALKMMEITMRDGLSASSSLAFVLYGMCLARRNLFREAFRLGRLGVKAADEDTSLGSQATTFHHYSISFWKRPFHSSLLPLQKVVYVAIDSNDMENISFRVGAFLSLVLATGIRLDSCDTVFRKFKEHSIAFQARETWLATIPFRLMLKLRGEPVDIAERGLAKYSDTRASQYRVFFEMIYAVMMQDMTTAEKLSARIFHKPEGIWLPLRGFYEGLIAISLARDSTGETRQKHEKKAKKIISVLGTWAKKGLRQVYHMVTLISCELRILSDASMTQDESSSLYDSAITAASEAGFAHHEALANERAGALFYLQQNVNLGEKYLTRACELYHAWGARAKVWSLKAKYAVKLPPRVYIDSPLDGIDQLGSPKLNASLNFGESQIIHFRPGRSIVGETGAQEKSVPDMQQSRHPEETSKAYVDAIHHKEVMNDKVADITDSNHSGFNERTSTTKRKSKTTVDGTGETQSSQISKSNGKPMIQQPGVSTDLDNSHRSASGTSQVVADTGGLLAGFFKWTTRWKKTSDAADRADSSLRENDDKRSKSETIKKSDKIDVKDDMPTHDTVVPSTKTIAGQDTGPEESLQRKLKVPTGGKIPHEDGDASYDSAQMRRSLSSDAHPKSAVGKTSSSSHSDDPSNNKKSDSPSAVPIGLPLVPQHPHEIGVTSLPGIHDPTKRKSKAKVKDETTDEEGKFTKRTKSKARSTEEANLEDFARKPLSLSSGMDAQRKRDSSTRNPRNHSADPSVRKKKDRSATVATGSTSQVHDQVESHQSNVDGEPIRRKLKRTEKVRKKSEKTKETGATDSAPKPLSLSSGLDAHKKHESNKSRSRNRSVEPAKGLQAYPVVTDPTGTAPQQGNVAATPIRQKSKAKLDHEMNGGIGKKSDTIKQRRRLTAKTHSDDSERKPRSLNSGLDARRETVSSTSRSHNHSVDPSKRLHNFSVVADPIGRPPQEGNVTSTPNPKKSKAKIDSKRNEQNEKIASKIKPGRHLIEETSTEDPERKPHSLSSGLDAHKNQDIRTLRSRYHSAEPSKKQDDVSVLKGMTGSESQYGSVTATPNAKKSKSKIEGKKSEESKKKKAPRHSATGEKELEEAPRKPRSLSSGMDALTKKATSSSKSKSRNHGTEPSDWTKIKPSLKDTTESAPRLHERDSLSSTTSGKKSKSKVEEKSEKIASGLKKSKSKSSSTDEMTTKDSERKPRSLSSGLEAYQKLEKKGKSRHHSAEPSKRKKNDPPLPESTASSLRDPVSAGQAHMIDKPTRKKSKAESEEIQRMEVVGSKIKKSTAKRRSPEIMAINDSIPNSSSLGDRPPPERTKKESSSEITGTKKDPPLARTSLAEIQQKKHHKDEVNIPEIPMAGRPPSYSPVKSKEDAGNERTKTPTRRHSIRVTNVDDSSQRHPHRLANRDPSSIVGLSQSPRKDVSASHIPVQEHSELNLWTHVLMKQKFSLDTIEEETPEDDKSKSTRQSIKTKNPTKPDTSKKEGQKTRSSQEDDSVLRMSPAASSPPTMPVRKKSMDTFEEKAIIPKFERPVLGSRKERPMMSPSRTRR